MPNSMPTSVAQNPAQQQRQQQRHAFDADVEVVGRIGAHRHEGAGAQRDLAAVADQDVQPQRRQRQDQERDQDGAEQVLVGQQRHADDGEGQQQPDGDAVLRDREDLLVGAVAGLELAVFAVEQGLRRRTGQDSLRRGR
jgi:hypothetical protein